MLTIQLTEIYGKYKPIPNEKEEEYRKKEKVDTQKLKHILHSPNILDSLGCSIPNFKTNL